MCAELSSDARARTIPKWFFRVLPPPLYHRMRRAPLLGPLFRRAFDAVVPQRGLVLARVSAGPLTAMVLELDPRTQIDAAVGRYEEGVVATVQQGLAEGDTAFDIGAHLGLFTLVMATQVGRSGRVVSFEPDPVVIEGLERNVKRNGAQTGAELIIVPAAVDAAAGRAGFVEGRETSRGRLAEQSSGLQVEVMTLDDITTQFGAPSLVKIDVEGRELGVLRGGSETLEARRTTFLIEAHTPDLERECRDLLAALGYVCEVSREPGRAESYLTARPPLSSEDI